MPSEASRWDAGRWKGVKMLTPESKNDDMSWHVEKKTFWEGQHVDITLHVEQKDVPGLSKC